MKKKIWIPIALLALLAGGAYWLFVTSDHQPGAGGREEQLYTCGMHPQVIQNKPGNCPICGMKLTPLRKQSGGASSPGERKIKFYKSTMNPGEVSPTPKKDSMGMDMVAVYEEEPAAAGSTMITIDPVTMQNMAIRTSEVLSGPLRRTVRTVGVIDFDETMLADVTTKFKGWIEKLYVDATGKQVHRGDPLFEIYSPELYSAQVEYVLALDQAAKTTLSGESLKATARTKLKFMDISDEQIAELEKTHQPKKTLRVGAPIDGFVLEKMAVEGMMLDAGMKLYRLADLGIVWVYAQVYEQDLPYIQLGQEATVSLSYMPDRKFRGRVTYIYPTVDEKTRTVRVRMEFHNPGYLLKPGMFTSVEVTSELAPSALLVPDSAVLRSGEKNTVFVALEGGKFEPRTVTLGTRAEGDRYQVLAGLAAGDRVVTSGQFMLDSESQLREAIQKMLEPLAAATTGVTPTETNTPSGHTISTSPTKESESQSPIYICPMPEHVSLTYSRPGKCPLCGMTLVPVSRELLAKIQPGGKIEGYTCPMPEHSDVRSDKPGKCPKCGMTLIPIMPKPAPPIDAHSDHGAAHLPSPLYTCPMAIHADVVSDKPGKCPKCDMDLIETSKVKHGKIAEENWRKKHPAPPVAPEHQH